MTLPPVRHGRIALACLLLASAGASAAPLSLSQVPPSASGREPAPNVLLTIDDSASMAGSIGGGDSRRKINLLKESLRAVFGTGGSNSGQIPDGRVRLAWQTLNGSVSGTGTLTPGAANTMKSFTGTHRTNFESFIRDLSTPWSTPTLAAMRRADAYARTTGTNSPWADVPGTAQSTPFLACRRMYHLLLTDGVWNSQTSADTVGASEGDSVTQTLGDGTTTYDINSAQSRVYWDNFGKDGGISTVADFAFRSWANDLQPGMANSVRPLIRKSGAETYTTSTCLANSACLATQEFWNPRNNPATWQHMVLHTIGFGIEASGWSRNAGVVPEPWNINNPSKDTYGGDLPRVIQGELKWPNVVGIAYREIDMWHAAINGRGKFYPVTTANGLTDAFTELLDNVIQDTSQPATSIATNSSRLRAGTTSYIAGYDSARSAGSLSARSLDAATGQVSASSAWDAAALLNAPTDAALASRLVLSANAAGGILYKWSELPAAMKTPMNRTSANVVDNKGEDRVDYIRGARGKEQSKGGGFRDRDSRLGTIVNSAIWYTEGATGGASSSAYASFRGTIGTRPPMLYVGANDGMLHGFDAATGQEKFAYIPRGIAEGPLRKLTDTDYSHQYMVDGSPFTGDALTGDATKTWKTVLVGSLGAGGRGYFVLDVTDPATFTTTMSTTAAAGFVLVDTTANTDVDIGHIVSPPAVDDASANRSRQIVKLNDGRWAVVMGNGVNSTNEAPVLLIQYLDGDRSLLKLSPCTQPIATTACSFKGNNGLATPRLVDLDGNGVPDVAYAGDLQGNVWKFNLGSTTSGEWTLAFSGMPLFSARRSPPAQPTTTVPQPITSAPYVVPHPAGGVMVVIGTGQNLTDADRTSTDPQSLYSLWDPSTSAGAAGAVTLTDAAAINTPAAPALTRLVRQTYNATPAADGDLSYFSSSNNAVNYGSVDSSGNLLVRGWYLDWPVSGQRVLEAARVFAGQKILVGSMVPGSGSGSSSSATNETCSAGATADRRFVSVLSVFVGGVPAVSPYSISTTITNHAAMTMVENTKGPTAVVRTDAKVKLVQGSCPAGQACSARDLTPGTTLGMRANWRQILR
jgi:type IV pilus assembly protein PilY1